MDPGDSVSISCPGCKKVLPATVLPEGTVVTCPACHDRFPFPAVSSFDLCKAQAARLGYRCVNLEETTIPAAVLKLIPETTVRRDKILPISMEGDQLIVAVSDPQAFESVDRLRFELDRPITLVMAPEDAILVAMGRYLPHLPSETLETSVSEPAESAIDFVEVAADDQPVPVRDILDPDSTSVTDRVHQLISEAFRTGALRVLIRPTKDRVQVAYRIHDAVFQGEDIQPRMLYSVLVKLMTMVNLHGVIKVSLGGQERRLHATFKPTERGLSALLEIPQDVSPSALCKAQAARFGYRLVNLEDIEISAPVLETVPAPVARQYKVLPVAIEGDRLLVVAPDPGKPEFLDNLRFILNRRVSVAIAPEGEILVAIDRYYGVPDPEVADLLRWELSQPPESASPVNQPSEHEARQVQAAPSSLAQSVLDYLRTLCGDGMLRLFETVRTSPQLCKKNPATGNLEVVFPQAHLMPRIPVEARKYLEDKIWVLREAIIARLENYLERDDIAKGMGMAYGQYLACCQIAEGQAVSIDPAMARDAWINFLYCFALQSFPSIDSNGTLLGLVTEHLKEVSAKVASLLDNPSFVVNPDISRKWVGRFISQTITDEPSDSDNPSAIHLVELLIADAFHTRASGILLLPWEDRIEVAYRVQSAVHSREGLSLRLFYPILARLVNLLGPSGEMSIMKGKKKRALQVAFSPTEYGVAAMLEIMPDRATSNACRDQAAKLGYEFLDLENLEIPAAILALIPKAIAWKKRVLPVAVHDGIVTVAVDTPPGPRRMDELKLTLQCPIAIALAPKDDILAGISRHYHRTTSSAIVSPVAVSMLRKDRPHQ
jgi:type II secretory ATPase GspE/PulE/Tfp pilus assembly ATPase PilB-like protein